jgi:hypothetical protein
MVVFILIFRCVLGFMFHCILRLLKFLLKRGRLNYYDFRVLFQVDSDAASKLC